MFFHTSLEQKLLRKTLTDYDLLDEFFYCLSNDDFDKK